MTIPLKAPLPQAAPEPDALDGYEAYFRPLPAANTTTAPSASVLEQMYAYYEG